MIFVVLLRSFERFGEAFCLITWMLLFCLSKQFLCDTKF